MTTPKETGPMPIGFPEYLNQPTKPPPFTEHLAFQLSLELVSEDTNEATTSTSFRFNKRDAPDSEILKAFDEQAANLRGMLIAHLNPRGMRKREWETKTTEGGPHGN